MPVHVIRQWTYGANVDEVLEMSTDLDGDQITTGTADARHFYHLNALGTVIGLSDESGQLVEGYTYDAYGEVTVRVPGPGSDRVWWDDVDAIVQPEPNGAPRSPSGNIWFFTGRQLDPETGTYHYRARNYHPYLGQFISMDPLGVWGDPGNLGNPYAYVGNNPGTYRDPSGLYTWSDFERQARDFGVGALAFVPAPQTDWARDEVRQNVAGFHATQTEMPAAVHFGVALFTPPTSQGGAAAGLALAAVPFGKIGKAAKVVTKIDEPAEALMHFGRVAEQRTTMDVHLIVNALEEKHANEERQRSREGALHRRQQLRNGQHVGCGVGAQPAGNRTGVPGTHHRR